MSKELMKTAKNFKKNLAEEIKKALKPAVEEIKAVIMSTYTTELIVSDHNSKTNPQLDVYVTEMIDRLDKFEYIKEDSEGKIAFIIPDMNNFDFSGSKMRVIEQILEGTAGVYVEVSAADYEKMFGKRVFSREPIDAGISKQEMIYLMRYNNVIRNAEAKTFGKPGYLVRYPFSNTPPISIFDDAEKLAGEKIDGWINKAVKIAIKKQRWAA